MMFWLSVEHLALDGPTFLSYKSFTRQASWDVFYVLGALIS